MVSVTRPAGAVEAQQWRDAASGAAAFIGGGTALQLGWVGHAPDVMLIDVSALPQAQGIALQGGALRIGAATRLEHLRSHALVREHAPLLAAACETLAAMSVRHLATLGGNVAWRFGDTLAALLASDAEAELAGGARVPLDALLSRETLPLIVALHVPCEPQPAVSLYEKVGLRAAFSPTRIALAVRADDAFRSVRVAAVGAGLVARRLTTVERLLREHAPPESLHDACVADLPGDVPRAHLAARLLAGHLGLELPR